MLGIPKISVICRVTWIRWFHIFTSVQKYWECVISTTLHITIDSALWLRIGSSSVDLKLQLGLCTRNSEDVHDCSTVFFTSYQSSFYVFCREFAGILKDGCRGSAPTSFWLYCCYWIECVLTSSRESREILKRAVEWFTLLKAHQNVAFLNI